MFEHKIEKWKYILCMLCICITVTKVKKNIDTTIKETTFHYM